MNLCEFVCDIKGIHIQLRHVSNNGRKHLFPMELRNRKFMFIIVYILFNVVDNFLRFWLMIM